MLLLPQITPIYQISGFFMHAVAIYWVCCKMNSMLHICCCMLQHPFFLFFAVSNILFNIIIAYMHCHKPFLSVPERYNICCNLIAAAASMQQYAATQHFNRDHSLEMLLLPQITPIYQISGFFMHAVAIYWVCCKMNTMLHICCCMLQHPVFLAFCCL